MFVGKASSAAMRIVLERAGSKQDDRLPILCAHATVAVAYHRSAGVYIADQDMQELGTAAVHLLTIATSYVGAQTESLSTSSVSQIPEQWSAISGPTPATGLGRAERAPHNDLRCDQGDGLVDPIRRASQNWNRSIKPCKDRNDDFSGRTKEVMQSPIAASERASQRTAWSDLFSLNADRK
jgi:hypothetical protein